MNNKSTTSDNGENKVSRVYTKLKFVKSDQTGAIISFVSQNPKTGRICGVRQDSEYPKKICILDKMLASEILLNVLYDCTLIPMTERNGYVVIAAEPVQFKATVTKTYVKNNIYLVEVKFGNKTIRFDPFNGRKESIKSLPACKAILERRVDVKNILQVVEDFDTAANEILALLENDRLTNARNETPCVWNRNRCGTFHKKFKDGISGSQSCNWRANLL